MTDGTPRSAPTLGDERTRALAEAGSRPARRARRHPARGSRFAAAGIGVTAMLGLMSAMGAAAPGAKTASPAPAPAAAPQHVVVVHRASAQKTGPDHSPSSAPIALTARRVVHTVVTGTAGGWSGSAATASSGSPSVRTYSAPPAASAPAATTSGSQ